MSAPALRRGELPTPAGTLGKPGKPSPRNWVAFVYLTFKGGPNREGQRVRPHPGGGVAWNLSCQSVPLRDRPTGGSAQQIPYRQAPAPCKTGKERGTRTQRSGRIDQAAFLNRSAIFDKSSPDMSPITK